MTCPVCLYPDMPYPPNEYNICPCCGTEFGSDDAFLTHAQLRDRWVLNGAPWFFREPPANWSPWIQLLIGGHPESVPALTMHFAIQGNSTVSSYRRDDYEATQAFSTLMVASV